MAMSRWLRDHVHRGRAPRWGAWLSTLLALSVAACGPTDHASEFEVVEPGEHPFDLLPEARLEELGSLGSEGVPFSVGWAWTVAPVSDTSFVALVREPGAEASGIAHVTVGGRVVSWVASARELQAVARGRIPNFGVSGDSVWIFASDRTGDLLILRSLAGDELGRRVAPVDFRSAFQEGATDAVTGILVGGVAFVYTSPSLPPLPRRVFPRSAMIVELEPGVPGDTLFRGTEVRPGLAGGSFTRAGLFSASFEPFGYPPIHHLASTGDRMVVVDWDAEEPADLEIRVWSFRTGEVQLMSVDLPRLRMPENVRSRVVDVGVEALDRMEDRRGRWDPALPALERGAEALQDYVHFPVFMPSVRAVHSGEDGTIWLLRDEPSPLYLGGDFEESGTITWIALDPDGVPLFRISLPERSRLVMASRSEIWTISLDDRRFIRWRVEGSDREDGSTANLVDRLEDDRSRAQEPA